MRTSTSSSEQQNIQSRLQKLRSQIYKPYKSILSPQTEQQSQPGTSMLKNYSLQLKSQRLPSIEQPKNIFSKKRSVRLPSIMKKKSSLLTETNLQMAVTDYVTDPFLNGRIKTKREQAYRQLAVTSNAHQFLKTVQSHELQFIENCYNRSYKQAQQIITRLLNYAIDLDLIDQLSFTIKILGDFHLECLQLDQAFFYYNEGRKCGLLVGQHGLMVQCLIQMAICAGRANSHAEAIRILKKTLEYIWYYDLANLELKLYDEIGKTYYLMGDVEKAKIFHYKFFTGGIEPKESSIRLLSKQSLVLEGLDEMVPIRNITSVFLWMIQMPIKNCEVLDQFENPYKTREGGGSPRKGYSKDMTYFQQFHSVRQAVARAFNEDFFKNELGEMYFKNPDWASPLRMKKYLSYDIQRNNHLKSLGIPFENYFAKGKGSKKKQIRLKIRKIKTEANEEVEQDEAIDVDKWFNSIAMEAIKKYRNKNEEMLNRVNVRGMDKHTQGNPSIFRTVYNQYFDLSISNSIHH